MRLNSKKLTMFLCCGAAAIPGMAQAQESDLMAMPIKQLRGEIESRYDTALAATLDPAVLRSTDSRYYWASEAKVQCGIAIGFLKSGNKDADSIGKCERFLARMDTPAPVPPPPPPAPPQCTESPPFIVFFDWDSAMPSPEASATVSLIAENRAVCNWTGFSVVGHTDRSGSDSYNIGLSERRALAVQNLMESGGIDGNTITVNWVGESQPKVQTVDGERNPTNRRVEIDISPTSR